MGYDLKERALGWGNVGGPYLVMVATIAGMALLLSAETPERHRLGDRVLQKDAASVATEGDRLTWSRNEALPWGSGRRRHGHELERPSASLSMAAEPEVSLASA